jgi:hypothetical protein
MVVCPNCSCERMEKFCPECGQENVPGIVPVRELFNDVIGDLFKLDARLWGTLWPLVSKPGFLTIEYLAGRRMRYFSPLKLYLSVAFLYFLVFGWLAQPLMRQMETLPTQNAQGRVSRRAALRATPGARQFDQRFQRRMPVLMNWQLANQNTLNLLMIPVYGVALTLLLLRQRRLYMEHVIFLLHTQAATYLLALPFAPFFQTAAGLIASMLPILIYYPLAFRRVYGPLSWLKTIGTLALFALLSTVLMFAVITPIMFIYLLWPWGG